LRNTAAPLTERRSVVVISDWVEGTPPEEHVDLSDASRSEAAAARWPGLPAKDRPWEGSADIATGRAPEVRGGYLERLPLALIAAGIAEQAEIWHHWRGAGAAPFHRDDCWLARRAFRLDDEAAPFSSSDMIEFVRRFGAPHILIVLGLGVAPALLEACAHSVIIYNSIDAPALRVPPEVSAHFDLVITGAQWQSDVVAERHPGTPTLIMPIGPEFAASEQFHPLGIEKDVDLIYVAAAQPYKRHDILFDALAQCPREVKTICLFGYGDDGEVLRARAAELGLSIEFIGPPGVPTDGVNRLMNRARFGVVCGVDDGAPAILTEYMLAGLPVLANAALSCGRQFIIPETGMTASADHFSAAIMLMRENYENFAPRQAVLERWTWPHSVAKLMQVKTFSEQLGKVPRVA
jgi:glycosyltransferase involved in cell wall biosynthesis